MTEKINLTGYKKGSKTEGNNYNIIPSNKITMEGVDKNLVAIKLDKEGKPIGIEFLSKGKNYEFDDTYSVLEVPQYQFGGGNPMFPIVPPVDSSLEGMSQKGLNNLYNQVNFSGAQPEEEIELSELETTTEELNAFSKTLDAKPRLNTDFIPNEVDKERNKSSNYELEPFKQSEFDNIQFFNPYGGVDIPTAATTLGQSISNKNTLGTVTSSVKLAAGLGRNVLGGLGAQKRTNQTMKDYYKKLREDGNVTSLQDGGSYTYTDNSALIEEIDSLLPQDRNRSIPRNINPKFSSAELAEINKGTGIQFTEEGANSLFAREEQIEPTVYPDLDLGRYKTIQDYYNVRMNGDKYVVSPGKRNFKNAQNYKDDLRYLQKLNPNAKFDGYNNTSSFIPNSQRRPENFQDGGMKKEELLTGEFITGIHEDNKLAQYTNANIEKGEYLATKEGDIAEVKGNKHSSGGENIIMEGGDRVLTDHTKLGASNAKHIRDKFDIKVKAKNTYSDALDKYRTKSGMSKLIKEEEGILKQIEDQKELEDSETKDLNSKFLQEKLGELTSKKSPLEEGRKFLYNELYNLQEKDKPKSEQALFQGGGGKDEDESKMEAKGINQREFDTSLERQGFTNEEKGLAGTVNEGNYLTVMDNLRQEFPSVFQEVFGREVDPNNVADGDGQIRNFFSYKPGKSFKDVQEGINKVYDNLISEIKTKIKDPAKQAEYIKQVEDEKFTGDKFKKLDSVVGDFSASRKNFSLKDIQGEIKEEVVQGELPETTKQALNALLLPDQYPMVPEGTQPALKNTRRYDRIEGVQIDPTKYLQQLNNQSQVAKRKNEGLTPNVKAAADANIDANTQKSISNTMLRIDASNIQSKNNAEIANARIQGREEDARVKDNLSFEKRQLTADSKTDLAFEQYFDKVREVNIGNFRQVNAINNANARHDNIQFDGNGYIVRDAPDFKNNLNAIQLAQMNTLLAQYEEDNKKKTN
jgi:hypothetical protein